MPRLLYNIVRKVCMSLYLPRMVQCPRRRTGRLRTARRFRSNSSFASHGGKLMTAFWVLLLAVTCRHPSAHASSVSGNDTPTMTPAATPSMSLLPTAFPTESPAVHYCPLDLHFDERSCMSDRVARRSENAGCLNWLCSLRLNCGCFTGKVSHCESIQSDKPGCIALRSLFEDFGCDWRDWRTELRFPPFIDDTEFECALDACLAGCSAGTRTKVNGFVSLSLALWLTIRSICG
jgi:hypothetical protein